MSDINGVKGNREPSVAPVSQNENDQEAPSYTWIRIYDERGPRYIHPLMDLTIRGMAFKETVENGRRRERSNYAYWCNDCHLSDYLCKYSKDYWFKNMTSLIYSKEIIQQHIQSYTQINYTPANVVGACFTFICQFLCTRTPQISLHSKFHLHYVPFLYSITQFQLHCVLPY